jgi:uroporphyrinogen-III synthase
MPVVAIGPQTETEASALGLAVAAVAETSDLDGLVAAVESLRR